jgi:dihydropyrimidinase
MYDWVIRGGTLVDAEGTLRADLAVEGSRIAAVGEGLEGRRVVDARGLWVLPGAIDAHTHMALPVGGSRSSDDFRSGSIAAACGGVTSLIDFTVGSASTTLAEDLRSRLEVAAESAIDYGLHGEIVGWRPGRIEEVRSAVREGLRSFKFFTAYAASGRRTGNGALLEAFSLLADLGAMALVHAEDEEVIQYLQDGLGEAERGSMASLARTRPPVCEAAAVRMVSWIAGRTGARLHIVHLSSGMGLDEVAAARGEGVRITAETCPQYLLLDAGAYEGPEGHLFSASPALRAPEDNRRLWEGLRSGAIDTAATDHCPFTREQKRWKGSFTDLPYGIPGVETLVPLLLSEGVRSGRLSPPDLARVTARRPAEIFGLFPRKGCLRPGADADLAVWDPEAAWRVDPAALHMNVDFSPYAGREIRGRCLLTLSRGEAVQEGGEFVGRPGRGRYLFGRD